jgi:hypothetical protein
VPKTLEFETRFQVTYGVCEFIAMMSAAGVNMSEGYFSHYITIQNNISTRPRGIITGGEDKAQKKQESVGHALRSALDEHPTHLLLSLGFKHAFNSVSRQAIFYAAQEYAPFLLPFLSRACGRPSRVFLRSAPDNSALVFSTSGVKQGEPVGPLVLAHTLQGPLQRNIRHVS